MVCSAVISSHMYVCLSWRSCTVADAMHLSCVSANLPHYEAWPVESQLRGQLLLVGKLTPTTANVICAFAACPAGTGLNEDKTACVPCQVSFYGAGGSVTVSPVCTACPTGATTTNQGSTLLTDCSKWGQWVWMMVFPSQCYSLNDTVPCALFLCNSCIVCYILCVDEQFPPQLIKQSHWMWADIEDAPNDLPVIQLHNVGCG